MDSQVVETERRTPLSLYIELAPATRGDIEVIGRAAIAWAQTIREAALVIDPFMEVRVELVSGTEGSLNLNSILHAVRGTLSDPVKLKAIAIGVAAYFAGQAGGWVVGKGYDALWELAAAQIGHPAVESLSPAERAEVEDIVERISKAGPAKEKAAEVYAELSKDRAVSGVGVSLVPEKRPPTVVPRREFAERSGAPTNLVEEVISRRSGTERLQLTLVSPVLADGEYKWKFQRGPKGFWALMGDETFRRRIAPGSSSAPRMVSGIIIDADVETTQEFRNGVWTNVKHEITRVYSLREPPTQPSLLDAPSEEDDPN